MADPNIITSVSTLQVPEGGQSTFNVKLSSRPRKRSVEVKVERISGDASIGVSSGQLINFSRRNYNQWQTVTLTASEDNDHTDGQATFKIYRRTCQCGHRHGHLSRQGCHAPPARSENCHQCQHRSGS